VHVTLYKVTAFHSQKEVGKDLFYPVWKEFEKQVFLSLFRGEQDFLKEYIEKS